MPFEQTEAGTYYVLAGLLVGKPVGILLFANAARLAGASPPPGLRLGDLLVVGVAASIGFTVALSSRRPRLLVALRWRRQGWGPC